MGKPKIVRMSGLPVSKANLEAYHADFKAGYDKLEAEAGLDMLKLHEGLKALDVDLTTKYERTDEQELPKSAKAWHKLINDYDCPIMIAKSQDNPKELVVVIMDEPLV